MIDQAMEGASTSGGPGKSTGNGNGSSGVDPKIFDLAVKALYYGKFKAVRDIGLSIEKGTITRSSGHRAVARAPSFAA
jgi:hypothetical protein